MKPPAYRVTDVLFMDKGALRSVIQVVRDALPLLAWDMSPKLRGLKPKLQMVGSYTFGNARLRSDMDFNLAFSDWNTQVEARRLFYIPDFRQEFGRRIQEFSLRIGLGVDVGCVDAETDRYNIHLDCETMFLHYRYEPDLGFYQPGKLQEVVDRQETRPAVDVMAFNPEKDEPPPVHNIHLKLDNYAFRWLPQTTSFKSLNSSWAVDDYAAEQEPWRTQYGSRYLDYRSENGRLIPI